MPWFTLPCLTCIFHILAELPLVQRRCWWGHKNSSFSGVLPPLLVSRDPCFPVSHAYVCCSADTKTWAIFMNLREAILLLSWPHSHISFICNNKNINTLDLYGAAHPKRSKHFHLIGCSHGFKSLWVYYKCNNKIVCPGLQNNRQHKTRHARVLFLNLIV